MNLDGVIEIEATGVRAESTLAKIIRLVEQAQGPAYRCKRWLISQCDICTCSTGDCTTNPAYLGGRLQDWTQGVLNAVAVLVIACPCALD